MKKENDIRSIMFIEDIKKRYDIDMEYAVTYFSNRLLITSNKIDKFEIGYNWKFKYFIICIYTPRVLLNFEKYEDMIEVADILYKSKDIYYYSNFLNSDIGLIYDTSCYIEDLDKKLYITNNKKTIKFEKIYSNSYKFKEIDRKVRNI